MPPKAKKGEKGKKKKKQTLIPIDDIDTTTLNLEKLQEYCVRVYDELVEEKQYSRVLELDRNKIANMTDIATERLKYLTKYNIRIKDDLRDKEEERRIFMANKRQKLLHLQTELGGGIYIENTLTQISIEELRKLNIEIEQELIADIDYLKKRNIQSQDDLASNIIELKKDQAQNIHLMWEESKKIRLLVERKHDLHLHETIETLQSMFSQEYKALETFKEKEYRRNLENNDKQTLQLKHYYNKIVNHNLEVVHLLKSKIQDTKTELSRLEGPYYQLKEEERRLQKELDEYILTGFELNNKLFECEKDKEELKLVKKRLKNNKELLLDSEVNYHILDTVKEKQNDLQTEMTEENIKEIFSLSGKSEGIILVLEYIAIHLANRIQELNVQLSNTKEACLKAGIYNSIFDQICRYEDNTLDNMKYEIANVMSERKDLLQTYREKLKKFNIHFDNTGFKPLRLDKVLKENDRTRVTVDEKEIFRSWYFGSRPTV